MLQRVDSQPVFEQTTDKTEKGFTSYPLWAYDSQSFFEQIADKTDKGLTLYPLWASQQTCRKVVSKLSPLSSPQKLSCCSREACICKLA